MVDNINSWAQGIIVAVIVATIVEMLLPEGNNKKYVKTVVGIYIIFIIIQPILSKISNKNLNILNNKNISNIIKNSEIKNNISLETSGYIENSYKEKIKENIIKELYAKGYSVKILEINFETESKENYGEILNIKLAINKKTDNKINANSSGNEIKVIEDVKIKTNNITETQIDLDKKTHVSEEEIEEIKLLLNSYYGIEKENIYIDG